MKSLLRKKALSTESPRQLDRTLTALDLTFLGIGAVIGTGIFVLTGIVAAKHSGPGIMLSFLIAAFTCACVAFCYAEFASSIPVSGSVYTYAYMTVGEVVAFIVAGAKYVKPENWTPFIPFGYDGIITGAATVFFAFLGFDAIATAAEETKKPQRDLPIGIIGSLLICTVLYMIVSFVLTGMVPYTQLDVSDPVAFALHFVGEDTIAGLLAVGAMTGMTTVLLVVMYGQVRVSYAMSRDGLLPKALSRVNKKVKIPLLNTWITGVFAALLAGLLDLHLLANLVNIGTLTAFTFVCFAVLILRKTHPDLKRGFRTPLVPALPVVAILCCLYLMTNLSKTTWISFSFWLIVGLCVYFFYSRKHSHLANEKTNDETKEA